MNILDGIKILDWLNDKDREELSMFCQEKEISKWEILFRQWDEANSMYIISKWAINITTEKNWEKIILWKVLSEGVLWEMALFWNYWSRTATAEATEDSTLITILFFSIKSLMEKNPELLNKIKEIIETRNDINKSFGLM